MTKALILCAFLVHAALAQGQALGALELTAQKASEGFIGLNWKEFSEEEVVRLQVALDDGFNQIVRDLSLTRQNKVHLSGFKDGSYFVRVTDSRGVPLTITAHFQVQHRDLTMATLLFALGATLFVFLLVTLFRFTRSAQFQQ